MDIEKDTSNDRVSLSYDDVDQNKLYYHLGLLFEAGFIKAYKVIGDGVVAYLPTSLTWEGHEFLDSIRNESVWNNIKTKLTDDLTSVPIKVLASVGADLTKEYFKNKLGLK